MNSLDNTLAVNTEGGQVRDRMRLSRIMLKGFRSISNQKYEELPLGDVTVLLGANGAGKSNIVLFFKMLNHMMTGALGDFVGKYGADQLLFYGLKRTDSLSFTLCFLSQTEDVEDLYSVELSHRRSDSLFVKNERIRHFRQGYTQPQDYFLTNQEDRGEIFLPKDTRPTSKVISALLSGIRAYQFHDTSDASHIRNRAYIGNSRFLYSDGGNLAAFLKMLHDTDEFRPYYDRIVRHIQTVMPQFRDFVLETVRENYLYLNWRDTSGSDYLFGPDQLSDGSLRFMALTSLLLQPPQIMPKVIVIDEPELGLHPAAVAELAGMVHSASQYAQILLATQSTRLVDEFSPEQIVIIERERGEEGAKIRQLDVDELRDWLREYSLSELWEKNVIGAQP